MKEKYDVVLWEGRISYRCSTSDYMEDVVATFDTEKEALQFIEKEKIRLEDEWIMERYGSMEEYMLSRFYS